MKNEKTKKQEKNIIYKGPIHSIYGEVSLLDIIAEFMLFYNMSFQDVMDLDWEIFLKLLDYQNKKIKQERQEIEELKRWQRQLR